jgi:hypothetical protein
MPIPSFVLILLDSVILIVVNVSFPLGLVKLEYFNSSPISEYTIFLNVPCA